ncbi:acetyl-CoA carboxylase biotin carboxyl carrier protein [Bosea vaviloviae]|uniref:Biotin carboxyl carrier protein of acetyl-CoA carboxylase n=1 Tax=Bosea vaviloviae TaxID=1526658 RepID=A0A1D7U5S7_9HYPH|nr:acetyl-CoA carboxylase biotin carboxyl carrier protein subunit [Bosea vaviloviae]AOO82682.1 acetyl-CoA carboxylase biotin carboxyl carrier protein subunit [Bosea vaviloviae]
MDLHHIKTLIDTMAASDLAEMEVSRDGWTLRLVRRAWPAPTVRAETSGRAASPPQASHGTDLPPSAEALIRAPLSGIVYLGSSPNDPPFVVAGQAVAMGTTLCVIEAMKMFNEVKAERDGLVEAVLVAAGDEVEGGQPLIRLV